MIKKLLRYPKSFLKKITTENLPRLSVSSRRWTFLYYLFFDKSFDRELQAVLAGKIVHIDEAKKTKANYFLLIRNTHRLEKGLLMKPRKAIFAKDYLAETIDSYAGICELQVNESGNSQMKWFQDVICEYFAVVDTSDRLIKEQQLKFNAVVSKFSQQDTQQAPKSIPYHRNMANSANISYEEFFKLCRQRRSVRWFLNKPVERQLIDKAILAANQAPSACNRQPFEYRIFDDPALVKEVVKFPMGTSGYGHSIPVIVVIVGNLDAYFDERDRHIIYIDSSLSAMSLMLALETMNLSTCSINWPDIEDREKKMEKFLNLKAHQRPIMCLAIGYPDPEGLIAFSEKRPLDQIRKYN